MCLAQNKKEKKMNNYFRVTAYHPIENTSVIIDTNGLFQQLWQPSSEILKKGFNIVKVSDISKFLDVNITRAETDSDNYILRATAKGEPESIQHLLNGVEYHAIKVGDKIYIPDKDRRV